jgi:hypothetical protein
MNNGHTRLFYRSTLLSLLVIIIGGCASGSKIMSDYDRSVDFGEYTTYNFMEGAGPGDTDYQGFFSKHMIEAITIEMEKRGYTKADDPDLWVNFNGILQDKTEVSTRSAPPPPMMGGAYYGYRGGYYSTWGGYGWGTETHVSEYTEGTFNIDLVDNKRGQLVWEAVGVGRVSQKDLANLREGVMKGVPKFFSHYPYVAGQSQPVTEKK